MDEEIPEDDGYEDDFVENDEIPPTPTPYVKEQEKPKPVLGSKPNFGSKPNIFATKKGSGGNPTTAAGTVNKPVFLSEPVDEPKEAVEDPKERLNRIMRERQQQLAGGPTTGAPIAESRNWS